MCTRIANLNRRTMKISSIKQQLHKPLAFCLAHSDSDGPWTIEIEKEQFCQEMRYMTVLSKLPQEIQ